ncbi:MAG: NAD(P)(+) transhydrogenase (Re/Si-specific) subunit beta [Verrucomicrobiota bacterium]
MATVINLAYIAAAILFIYGIKMLGRADTARKGNLLSSVGMLLAVLVTLFDQEILAGNYVWLFVALAVGAAIGVVAAKVVKMTSMPELVALFNGFGGMASLLVGWAEYQGTIQLKSLLKLNEGLLVETVEFPAFTAVAVLLTIVIGGITFTGSLYAFGKLSGKLSGQAKTFPSQMAINAGVLGGILLCGLIYLLTPMSGFGYLLFLVIVLLALALGVLGVMPIGGGDMPVVISLLNSFSGLAAAFAGFVIMNNVLIVAGCLVGASGLILTVIMCKAMNRDLKNVLFSGFGASAQAEDEEIEGEMKAASVEDAYYVLEAARDVVIVPGYGMAVAQAQHVVKELGELLEANGAEVRYAIHPVAGRMPGHMNVLLAEADVPYEQLCEMDAVNPTMPNVDFAIVIGANDVVNPAAARDESSPIYGMPIINCHEAKTVYALKRGKGAGFSGLVNKLYFLEKTRMLYGDAKSTVSALVSEFKSK